MLLRVVIGKVAGHETVPNVHVLIVRSLLHSQLPYFGHPGIDPFPASILAMLWLVGAGADTEAGPQLLELLLILEALHT